MPVYRGSMEGVVSAARCRNEDNNGRIAYLHKVFCRYCRTRTLMSALPSRLHICGKCLYLYYTSRIWSIHTCFRGQRCSGGDLVRPVMVLRTLIPSLTSWKLVVINSALKLTRVMQNWWDIMQCQPELPWERNTVHLMSTVVLSFQGVNINIDASACEITELPVLAQDFYLSIPTIDVDRRAALQENWRSHLGQGVLPY